MRLQLDSVTLCCVDTRSPAQALYAIRQCMRHAGFGRVLFLGPAGLDAAALAAQGIEYVAIPSLTGIAAYSHFMLKELVQHIQTSHVLVIQWDGYVTHPECWRDQFLAADYIGAPWAKKRQQRRIGNGGFSLRSRRLLQALAQMDFSEDGPEDEVICLTLRPALERDFGLRFAELEVADAFAVELEPHRRTFGFHGMHNFAHEMSSGELRAWLDAAPGELIRGMHARKLVKSLIERSRCHDALDLLSRRRRELGLTWDHVTLQARLWLRWASPRGRHG